MTKALLITQCLDHQMWYADMVGCLVPYIEEDLISYRSRQVEGYINFVEKEDGMVVDVDTPKYYDYETLFK